MSKNNGPNMFEFTQGDRMRRAMKVSGESVQGMAAFFDVTRETISTWLNGRHAPSKAVLMMWAAKTGAPFEWLDTGKVPDEGNSSGGPQNFELLAS